VKAVSLYQANIAVFSTTDSRLLSRSAMCDLATGRRVRLSARKTLVMRQN